MKRTVGALQDGRELTFEQANYYLSRIPGSGPLSDPDIRRDDGAYTPLALEISDQSPFRFIIRADGEVVGTTSGSMLTQVGEAMDILYEYNPRVFVEGRCGRYRRFPPSAISEVLYNSMIHSDHRIGWNVFVDIEDLLMVVTAPGGRFRPDYNSEPTMSAPRNRELAFLMVRAGVVRLRYEGTSTIKNAYRSTGLKPGFMWTDTSFVTRLPACDSVNGEREYGREMVERYLAEHSGVFFSDICSNLTISRTVLRSILRRMEKEGAIIVEKEGDEICRYYLS